MDSNQQQAQRINGLGLISPAHLQRALQETRPEKDLCAVLFERGLLPSELIPQIRRESAAPMQANLLRSQVAQSVASISMGDPHFAPHITHVLERKEELGRGGMGVVYRVFDKRLKRDAAMKLLLHGGEDAEDHLRFQREAEVMAQLDHPAIPPVYELGMTPEGEAYMLMKLVDGVTLAERMKAFQFRDRDDTELADLLRVLFKVSEAMASAHSKGFLHRDLKPSNIMVGPFGDVQIMDWGLTRKIGQRESRLVRPSMTIDPGTATSLGLTKDGTILGTPGYMAPEQISEQDLDERIDVFALGAILTELLTGRPAIVGKTPLDCLMATMNAEFTLPRQVNSAIPPELHELAANSMAFDKDDRISSMEDLGQGLLSFLEKKNADSELNSRAPLWLLVLASLLFVVSGLFFFLSMAKDEEQSSRVLTKQADPPPEADVKPAAEPAPEPRAKPDYSAVILEFLRGAIDRDQFELKLDQIEKSYEGPGELIACAEFCERIGEPMLRQKMLMRASRLFPESNLVRFKMDTLSGIRLDFFNLKNAQEILRSGVEDEYFLIVKALEETKTMARSRFVSEEKKQATLDLINKAIQSKPEEADFYVVRGSFYGAMRRFDEAYQSFSQGIERRPGHAIVYAFRASTGVSKMVMALQSTGKPDLIWARRALSDSRKAYQLDGRLLSAKLQEARLLQMIDRLREAEACFLTLLTHPLGTMLEKKDAQLGLASLYEKEENYDKALEYYRSAQTKSQDIRLTMAIGRVLVLKEDYSAALPLWKRVTESRPDPYSLIFLGRAYNGLRRHRSALSELNKIQDPSRLRGTQGYDYFYTRGVALARLGQLDEAVSMLTRAVNMFPRILDSRIELIKAYTKKRALQSAYQQLNEAKRIHPNNLRCLTVAVSLELSRRNYRAAVALCENAIRAKFETEAVMLELARVYSSKGDGRALEKHLKRVITLFPQSAKARLQLAEMLQKRGDFQGAYRSFKEAGILDPSDLTVQLKLGQLAWMLEDFEAAAFHYSVYLTKAQNFSLRLYLLRAEAYFKLKQYSNALDDLNRALKSTDPRMVAAYVTRARVYVALNKKREAIKDLQRFLRGSEADPSFAKTRETAKGMLKALQAS